MMIREQVIDRTTLSLALFAFFAKMKHNVRSHIWHENGAVQESRLSGIHAGGRKMEETKFMTVRNENKEITQQEFVEHVLQWRRRQR